MILRAICVVAFFIAFQTVAIAQPNFYFGPIFSYHVPVTSPEGEVDGGIRSGAGLLTAFPLSKMSELRAHAMYRTESGDFRTYQDVLQPGGAIHSNAQNNQQPNGANNQSSGADNQQMSGNTGRLNVVTPGQRPYILSSVSLRAIEVGVSYWLRLAAIDTLGTNVYFGAGVLADRILSGNQVDNYANADVLPTDSVEKHYEFAGQFGGGGFLGASIVFPIGDGRLGLDMTYAIRLPSELAGQNIEWLTGRCLRFSAHYDFAL